MRRTIYIFVFGSLACGPMFYQAPPPLGTYPERLPAKRWAQLFKEAAPIDPALPAGDALDEQCRDLPKTLATLDAKGRLAELDRLLKLNRDGDYSSARANLLWELRELAADDTTFEAAESYIAWRTQPQPKAPEPPPADCPWDMEKEEWTALKVAFANHINERLANFTRELDAAMPRLKPNWRLQRGAFLFHSGRFADAAADFAAVLPSEPELPETADDADPAATPPPVLTGRQPAAAIMLARCEIELSRALGGGPAVQEGEEFPDNPKLNPQVPELRLAATTRLLRLIEQGKTHPHPYVADAHGWLAAIAADGGELGRAVEHQLDRLEAQPTREITRTVLRECDALFAKIIAVNAGPDRGESEYEWEPQFNAARIARHPLVARLFVQHAIDPAANLELPLLGDNDSGDRYTIDFLKQRILLPRPFIGYAMRSLGRELLARKTRLDPVTLTLVAWSSTEAGEHEQALALLDQIRVEPPSDETLQARATVLRRMGRHAEAVAVLDQLASLYPTSPLANNLAFQRAIGLFRAGRSGDAITAFARQHLHDTAAEKARWQESTGEDEHSGKPAAPSWPRLEPEYHLIQWLDTLVRFAPLADLATAITALPKDEPLTEELRSVLRSRALASGDFALARNHLSPGEKPSREEWEGARYQFDEAAHLDAEKWEQRITPLEKLTAGLAAAKDPAARERLHLALARHWFAHRGMITLPATGACYYANSQEESQDLLRRRNALELGFSRASVEAALDRTDEATHALEHALAAARSEDPAVAAPALELANLCLFRRAEFSIYQKSRALETRSSNLSRDIHDQLRQRFPNTTEARRAVHHVFTPAAGRWMPGDYTSANSVRAMLEVFDHRPHRDPWDPDEAAEALHAEIAKLPARFDNPPPGTKLKDLRRDLLNAKRQLDKLRPATDPDAQEEVLAAIDRLDDLAAAASLPDITVAEFADYANGRHDSLPPQFKSLLDFRERLKILKDENDNDQGPANDTIAGWREFLETYPDSPKREAASLRLTRLIARQYRGAILVRAFHFPDAPIPNGYKHIAPDRPQPNRPEVVLDAILNHQSNHSTGRYQDDIDLLRAGALTDSGNPSEALMLLEKILANPAQRDLHPVALLNLGEIALDLLEPAKRLPAATALRTHPASMALVKRLILGDTCLSRLQPLLPWLEDRPAK
jgi:hypothetical protein